MAELLSNNRFIHMKIGYLARTCKALLMSQMKQHIFDKSTIYQIGGQARHSTSVYNKEHHGLNGGQGLGLHPDPDRHYLLL